MRSHPTQFREAVLRGKSRDMQPEYGSANAARSAKPYLPLDGTSVPQLAR
jgi:hypothetical protein